MGMEALLRAMRPRTILELVQERHPPGSYSRGASSDCNGLSVGLHAEVFPDTGSVHPFVHPF